MTKENKDKIGFFKRMYLAIKEFEQYGIFAAEDVGTAIKYLLKITLILVLVVTGVFIYQFHIHFQGAIQYFNENIHEIHFANSNLEINKGEKIEIKNNSSIVSYVLIDTDASKEQIAQYQEELENYEGGIIVLKDKIIYKNQLLSQTIEYYYNDILQSYEIGEFDKQGVLNFIAQIDTLSLYSSIFVVMFIYLYMIYLLTAFVDIIMLAVLGLILGRMIGMKIHFKATFNIGVYALTLPILLNLIYMVVNKLTGFTIQYFSWMYTTISYIYVIVAILIIKTDFINRQAELMKIIEEQEKVRQEMNWKKEQERKEEEKNENKDNKGEEPKEEKKHPNKRKKEDNLGNGRTCTTRNKADCKKMIKEI